jgi:antitoxin Phd
MRNWQLQEAKAKFSEVIELAATGEAQVITKRGEQTAVVVSHTEYMRLLQKSKSALEGLAGAPKGELKIHRDNSPVKPVQLG